MMETELTTQEEEKLENSLNQFRKDIILSKYAKIQSNEELYIDPKDIQLGASSENVISGSIGLMGLEDLSGPISIETSKKFFCKKIGNCFCFLGNRKGDPIFIIGPNWLIFSIILSLVTIFFFLFIRIKWNNLGGLMKFIGIMIFLVYLVSHIYTEIINPGYPKHNLDSKTGEPRSKYEYCSICKIWVSKEKNTKHCVKCDICVEGYVNHYRWMSKCIGRNNQMLYYIFLGSFVFIIGFIFCILATKSNKPQENMNNLYIKIINL